VHRKARANGPFSIIITTDMPKPTMIGHSDRKKLRPMIAALSEDGKTFYLASELNSIHAIDKTLNYWQPDPGKPVIASLGEPVITGTKEPLEGLNLA
jgi:glutamate synthase domain-containing protein 1